MTATIVEQDTETPVLTEEQEDTPEICEHCEKVEAELLVTKKCCGYKTYLCEECFFEGYEFLKKHFTFARCQVCQARILYAHKNLIVTRLK